MIHEQEIERNLGKSDRGLIETLSQDLPGGTEVNHDKTSITISGDLAEI
jgi:hypothetical protein